METDNSFILNASGHSKSFGHNKFQIQLQDSNCKIELLEQTIKDKDNELELFKNNIQTFQIQFQKQNIEILQLNKDIQDSNNHLETTTLDLHKLNMSKSLNDTSMENKCNGLHDENFQLLNSINQVHKTKNEIVDKYNDLKSKYQTTFDLLEKKSIELNGVLDNYKTSINELNLLKELNLKQRKNIETVKQEICQVHYETSFLKSQLSEKNILLGELNRKLSLEEYTVGKILEPPIYIQDNQELLDNELKQEVTNTSRQVKITNQRGVKLSKR